LGNRMHIAPPCLKQRVDDVFRFGGISLDDKNTKIFSHVSGVAQAYRIGNLIGWRMGPSLLPCLFFKRLLRVEAPKHADGVVRVACSADKAGRHLGVGVGFEPSLPFFCNAANVCYNVWTKTFNNCLSFERGFWQSKIGRLSVVPKRILCTRLATTTKNLA